MLYIWSTGQGNTKDLWINGRYNSSQGAFTFLDGTPIYNTTDLWAAGQPDENACTRLGIDGFWWDRDCRLGYGFICERKLQFWLSRSYISFLDFWNHGVYVVYIWKLSRFIRYTSGSRGGGRTRRAPPLTAADLWFFYAQNANFLIFSSLASLAIHFKSIFNRYMAKTR